MTCFKSKLSILLVVVFVLALFAPAFAEEQAKPPMDLPVYTGGETSMEINMSNEDILPMVQALMPLAARKFGDKLDKINSEDLTAIFKNVKRIEVLQLDVDKPKVAESDITKFYSQKLPKGNWTRVFWQSAKPIGTIAVYTQGTGDAIYAFKVSSVKVDDKTVKRVIVAKMEGKIDIAQLVTLAAKVM